ncbi:unnamed protein product [Brassica napus]|uniref:(rape) hypothetical protein n=1 Tax=Brassica napus TaxID=3708 RepID=A0A816K1U3_BRANA|nr:unnamed protein product [Brassica napus]
MISSLLVQRPDLGLSLLRRRKKEEEAMAETSGFDHSTASFCVLIHTLVKSNLFWPASSLLQTLLLRELNPSDAFHALYTCYEKCKLGSSSSSSFDLLIQHYVRSRRGLDGVLVFRSMTKVGLLPEVKTLSALLHGLVHCRHYGLVMEVFEETIMLCSQQLKMSPSEKNLLTILTIKAVVANDLFTDDNFMCNKDCASVLQRELLESNTFVSDINNGRCDSVFPQVSQLKLPRNKLEDLYEQVFAFSSLCGIYIKCLLWKSLLIQSLVVCYSDGYYGEAY